jgi:hypothetical protein
MSFSKRAVLFLLSSLLTVSFGVAYGQSTPSPRIFYSDLESGPDTGGQNGQGVFVTIYGQGFGATQGNSSVNISGSPAYGYRVWSDAKITFQLGSGAVTGQIIANVSGIASNGVPFTVRPGRIYFVATNGNDSQKQGSYNKPWRTLARAKSSMRPGDIVYAMNGVAATGLDSSNASLAITSAGSSGNPMAIVAYPGATVTVGSETGQTYGIAAPSGGYNYWVLAGLKVRGAIQALNVTGATNWRLVGNDISCPNGNGTGACVYASLASQIKFLGNYLHDSGSTTSPDVVNYDSARFSGSNNIEVGWNEIGNTRSCRALTFSTGATQYGLTVHDNYIHDAVCDGLNLASVDPATSGVIAYNNVIQRVGKGPAPGGTESTYACINAASGSSSGNVQILNNTLYDCGARGNADSGGIATSVPVTATNNIIFQLSGEDYITANTSTSSLSGGNDLFWGAGAIPAPFVNSLNTDPEFVDPATANFHLQPSSPAIDAGISTGVSSDADGVPRPQGSANDIGAYEFVGTGGTAPSGKLVANPTTVNFGTVTTGTSNTQSVSVSNSGSADLTISQMNVTGAGFTATGMNLPATLSPGQSTSFTVTFAPQNAGAASGSVALISSASNSTNAVQLSGTGTNPASTLTASPSSLSFGTVNVGSSSSQTVTVTANTAGVTISQAAASGAGFTLSGSTLPLTLAAGQSASFAIKFAPQTSGSVTGNLSLTSNASNSPTNVSLSGSGGTPVGTLAASPTSLSFGSVSVGNSSVQNVTVTASTATVTISQAAVSGTGFSISGLTLPKTLTAGQSATFQVKFAPTVAGSATGSLSLTSNASNSPNVSLSGTGATGTTSTSSIWSSSVTPATIDTGDASAVELGVQFKADVSGSITGVRYYKSSANTGVHKGNLWTSTGTLLASATFTGETASGWQQVNFSSPVPVTAGTIYVASYYAPIGHYSDNQNYFATAGVDNAPLHALQNGGVFAYGSASSFPTQAWNASNYWVDVVFTTTGGGTQTGTLTASPTSLNFGSVSVGGNTTQNVTVTAGSASVAISQANVTGAGFSVSGLTLPTTLAAGQSATFQVKFAPTIAGSVTGSASLVSNASNTPATIALSGTGTTTTSSHSATLNWTASTSTNVVGYYIYRGTQTGGPYTKVNSTAVAATTYTDSNVLAGTTYYYVVTAVNGSGQESGYSSQVSATIPTP